MIYISSTSSARRVFQRLLAAAFLIFLLVEWGSHSLAFSHTGSTEGTAVHYNENEHDDPCKTLIRCPDGNRQDAPNVRSDGNQHTAFPSTLLRLHGVAGLLEATTIERGKVPLLRPNVRPPFHPPEFS